MFLGRHEHSLDTKGRLTLPADFRIEFGERAILSPGPDDCVSIWVEEQFQERTVQILEMVRSGQLPRDAARAFASRANKVGIDSHGRLVVPNALREFARLERDVVVNGAISHVEIWNPERFAEVDDTGSGHLRDADLSLSDISF